MMIETRNLLIRVLRRSLVHPRCHGILLGILTVLIGTNYPACGETVASREYKVKVAYLYNFARYVTWPDAAFGTSQAPFVIGVLGNDPFGSTIDLLASKKKIGPRDVVVRRFSSLDEYQPCQILFVSGTQCSTIHERVLQATTGKPVLVVGDAADFTNRGATVSFFADANGTVGFSINIDAVQRQNLTVQASVLKLASIVRDGSSLSSN